MTSESKKPKKKATNMRSQVKKPLIARKKMAINADAAVTITMVRMASMVAKVTEPNMVSQTMKMMSSKFTPSLQKDQYQLLEEEEAEEVVEV
jgi:ribonuclease HII